MVARAIISFQNFFLPWLQYTVTGVPTARFYLVELQCQMFFDQHCISTSLLKPLAALMLHVYSMRQSHREVPNTIIKCCWKCGSWKSELGADWVGRPQDRGSEGSCTENDCGFCLYQRPDPDTESGFIVPVLYSEFLPKPVWGCITCLYVFFLTVSQQTG